MQCIPVVALHQQRVVTPLHSSASIKATGLAVGHVPALTLGAPSPRHPTAGLRLRSLSAQVIPPNLLELGLTPALPQTLTELRTRHSLVNIPLNGRLGAQAISFLV